MGNGQDVSAGSAASGRIISKIWPLIRYHLWGALVLAGILLLFGFPHAGFGLLFGAILGTINAAVMAQRLENSIALVPENQNLYLHFGMISRFGLVLVLMGMGFYFFQLHVVSLICGFVLFQITCLFVLLREAKKKSPEKAMVTL